MGSNIIAELLRSHEDITVIAAVSNEQQARDLHPLLNSDPRVEFRLGRLPRDPWDLGSVDRVIHCAGLLIGNDAAALLRVNVEGTQRLLEAALRHGVPRFVYLSSQSIYGISRSFPQEEEMLAHPSSLYASSKYVGELLCLEKEYEGFNTVLLRILRIHGKRVLMRTELLPHHYAGLMAQGKDLPIFIHTYNSASRRQPTWRAYT